MGGRMMMNVVNMIDWNKCADDNVSVVVRHDWGAGWIDGIFPVPKKHLQDMVEVHAAFRRCRGCRDSGMFIDCDCDALLMNIGIGQTDLWYSAWPNDVLPLRKNNHFCTVNKPVQWEGLLPVLAQDADSHVVLMLAWVTAEAFAETLRSNRACYFSRSRQKLWKKGEESGNVQFLRTVTGMFMDEKLTGFIFQVDQQGGAACHEGYRSCFFRRIDTEQFTIVGERVFDPSQVYKLKG